MKQLNILELGKLAELVELQNVTHFSKKSQTPNISSAYKNQLSSYAER